MYSAVNRTRHDTIVCTHCEGRFVGGFLGLHKLHNKREGKKVQIESNVNKNYFARNIFLCSVASKNTLKKRDIAFSFSSVLVIFRAGLSELTTRGLKIFVGCLLSVLIQKMLFPEKETGSRECIESIAAL